jgi:hypothetical protein
LQSKKCRTGVYEYLFLPKKKSFFGYLLSFASLSISSIENSFSFFSSIDTFDWSELILLMLFFLELELIASCLEATLFVFEFTFVALPGLHLTTELSTTEQITSK